MKTWLRKLWLLATRPAELAEIRTLPLAEVMERPQATAPVGGLPAARCEVHFDGGDCVGEVRHYDVCPYCDPDSTHGADLCTKHWMQGVVYRKRQEGGT